ncbi:hypothetical protein AB0K40_18005 [Nonomuraea bangladeshensis]|uniref:Holliday junction endonuclease n=1 Tax=Nonomuraea bangladeshensis TaxID=404385 RepID=A0ABV3H4E9_9ACTN
MTPCVTGIDPSLTGTAVANHAGTKRIRIGNLRGSARFSCIADGIFADGTTQAADLVVIEGPSYGSMSGAGHHEAAGLWWHIVYRLDELEVPYAVVPPSTLKKYATGRGNATKPDMRVALLKRAGLDLRDDNEVDAWWLRAAGLEVLGHPLVELPAAQRDALNKVTWPVKAVAR